MTIADINNRGIAQIAGRNSTTTDPEFIESASGALLTTTIIGGITHIREEIGEDATAKTFDWSATPIRAVSITVTADTAGTAQLPESLVICIDPPNSAVRDAWLTEADSLTSDSQRIAIPINTTSDFLFTSDISYIGFKRDDGTGTLRVFAAGVEV